MKPIPNVAFESLRDWTGDLVATQRAVMDAGDDIDAVMRIVVESALTLLPRATSAVIALNDGRFLRIRAASGTAAPSLGVGFPRDGSFAARAIDARHTILRLGTASEVQSAAALSLSRQICAIVAVPLPCNGEIAGVLEVHSDEPGAFGEHDRLAAELLAGPVIVALSDLRAADALRARHVADRRFESIFNHAPVGIAHVAPNGRFLCVNDRFCEITGRSRADSLTYGFQQITHPDDLDVDMAHIRQLLDGEVERYAMEKRYLRPDGSVVWVKLTVALVRDAQHAPDFFVSVIEDLSEIKRAEAEALRDPLTGLLNRRGMIERIARESARALRRDGRLCLLFIDLDGFKRVNDRHGHSAGDACLAAIARTLEAAIRPGDAAGRVGGDEFVIVVRDGEADLPEIAERLREAITSAAVPAEWRVSASASVGGLCAAPGNCESPEALIDRADQAMFEAKRAGKDRAYLIVE